MIKAINDAFNSVLPSALPREVRDRIDSVQLLRLGKSNYDPFGMSPDFLKSSAVFPYFLYKHYFRVGVEGIENVPRRGRAILISNHSGTFPIDGVMMVMAILLETQEPRMLRSLVDYWSQALPFVSSFFLRTGQVVGVLENAERLLENQELVLIFPEGTNGLGKPFTRRYKLQDFTVGFVDLSVRFQAPIVPVAVIGAEEQYLNLANLQDLAQKYNMPYFPLTPTFPLLGPLGLIPHPSRYKIYFGEPLDLRARGATPEMLDDPEAMKEQAEFVRGVIQAMVDKGLEQRRS